MSRCLCFVVLIALSMLRVQSQADAQTTNQKLPFSLDQAIQLATDQSPHIRILTARLSEAQSERGAARSEFMPQLGVAAGMERLPAYSKDPKRVTYGYASWNLFNGFRDRRVVQASGFDIAAIELALNKAKFELAREIEVKFYEILTAMRRQTIAKETADLNAVALKEARQRRGAGMASEGDVLAFEVRQSRLDIEVLNRQSDLEMTRSEFMRLIGYEVGQEMVFHGDVPRFRINESLSDLFQSVRDSAFSLRQASIDVARSDVEMNQWVAGVLPRVDFETRHGWLPLGDRTAEVVGDESVETAFLLTAKMDLFSGLSTVHQRRAAVARKTQSSEQLREASLTLTNDIERQWRKISILQDRIGIEFENTAKTMRFLTSTSREYRSGVKSAADYAAAVDLVADSRQRLTDALLTWHQTRSSIETLTGRRLAVTEVR